MDARKVIARKKRRREMKRLIEKYAGVVIIAVVLVTAICLFVLLAAGSAKGEPQEVKGRGVLTVETQEEEQPDAYTDPDNFKEPFNRMSADWGTDDVQGFTLYQIPPEYKCNWGVLPGVVQVYTFCLCREYGVDYETVLAIIEKESGYKWDAKSAVAYGYMQIIPEYHYDRMDRLHVSDIQDPYGNISVGINYLAELLEKYSGNYDKALTAYRWGVTGAYTDYFSAGLESSAYSEEITEIADRIREQTGGGEDGSRSDAGTVDRTNDTD